MFSLVAFVLTFVSFVVWLLLYCRDARQGVS